MLAIDNFIQASSSGVAMHQNVGTIDRSIRLATAVVATLSARATHGALAITLLAIAAIGAASGTMGWALPYQLLGIDTRNK
jgi:hypothetical protein